MPHSKGFTLQIQKSLEFETLVEVAGIEPASRNLSDSASTHVVHFLI
jgi:hypothetical protein